MSSEPSPLTHHLAPRACERRADRRGQAEAHGAEAARGEQRARLVKRQALRDPHLVLAHVGGDDGAPIELGREAL
jgi:hypothetical protein